VAGFELDGRQTEPEETALSITAFVMDMPPTCESCSKHPNIGFSPPGKQRCRGRPGVCARIGRHNRYNRMFRVSDI
jgi:hypothetical protein